MTERWQNVKNHRHNSDFHDANRRFVILKREATIIRFEENNWCHIKTLTLQPMGGAALPDTFGSSRAVRLLDLELRVLLLPWESNVLIIHFTIYCGWVSTFESNFATLTFQMALSPKYF